MRLGGSPTSHHPNARRAERSDLRGARAGSASARGVDQARPGAGVVRAVAGAGSDLAAPVDPLQVGSRGVDQRDLPGAHRADRPHGPLTRAPRDRYARARRRPGPDGRVSAHADRSRSLGPVGRRRAGLARAGAVPRFGSRAAGRDVVRGRAGRASREAGAARRRRSHRARVARRGARRVESRSGRPPRALARDQPKGVPPGDLPNPYGARTLCASLSRADTSTSGGDTRRPQGA